MQIPKQIKVGGIKYKVKLVDEDELEKSTVALISAEKCLIKIMKGDPQFMNESFWHEVFHAINMEFKEEEVEFLAQAIYQIVVDNPHIFEGGVQHGKK